MLKVEVKNSTFEGDFVENIYIDGVFIGDTESIGVTELLKILAQKKVIEYIDPDKR